MPAWLSLPPRIDVRLPEGVRIASVESTVVSHEMPRFAALSGVLRNVGRPLRGARLRLTVVADDQSTIAVVESDVTPRAADTNALVPFRFGLKPWVDRAAQQLVIDIDEDDNSTWRTHVATVEPGYRLRVLEPHGVSVSGTLTSPDQAAIGAAARITLLLRDKDGRILDVLMGRVAPDTTGRAAFAATGEFPLARRAKALDAWVETRD